MKMYKSFEDEMKRFCDKNLNRNLRHLKGTSNPVKKIFNEKEFTLFCSNDYLGLSVHPLVKKAVAETVDEVGLGSGASRLISGSTDYHLRLERSLAEFKKKDRALLFPTGFMANLGVITALADKETLVITDKLNHASIIDGCRLSGAEMRVYPHGNMQKLEKILKLSCNRKRIVIVTDSIFSMDGDAAVLPKIVFLKKKYNALLVIDEAHATGVIGENGAGLGEHYDCEKDIDVAVGTLSKAVGAIGGFAATSSLLGDYMVNKSRPFIYTTSLPSCVCAAALKAIEIISEGSLRRELFSKRNLFEAEMQKMGICFSDHLSPIYPLVIGSEKASLNAAEFLFCHGFFVPAVRPPTVAKGSSRLRVTLSSAHSDKDILGLCKYLRKIMCSSKDSE